MLVNTDNGNVLASNVRAAATFWSKFRGLMLAASLPRGTALHIESCRCIHTFFMRFAIDVLYLDNHHRVVAVDEWMKPGRVGRAVRGATSVVELPAGLLSETRTTLGHKLSFQTNSI